MEKRNIIVIGASAGGFEALKQLAGDLPAGLDASVFIVWHMSPDVRGILPQVLNKKQKLFAAHAFDKETIKPGRIYVAPPDHHLLIEKGIVRISRGPKENRFRPAVDPLFRSAALVYGPRVIGVILSGALDDGSAGLWAVKQQGGLAVVQHPYDAEVKAMPENAIKEVRTDYIVPVAEMGELLTRLANEQVAELDGAKMEQQKLNEMEVQIALEAAPLKNNVFQYGEPTRFTCPECHGVLSALKEGDRVRFRCHTGHCYSADSLLSDISESIESALWSAIRNVQESVLLLNHMGDHFAEANQPKVAAVYFKKANEAGARANIVRSAVMDHEKLSVDGIEQQAETDSMAGSSP